MRTFVLWNSSCPYWVAAGIAQGVTLTIAPGRPTMPPWSRTQTRAMMCEWPPLMGNHWALQPWQPAFYPAYFSDGVIPTGRLNRFLLQFDLSSIPAARHQLATLESYPGHIVWYNYKRRGCNQAKPGSKGQAQ